VLTSLGKVLTRRSVVEAAAAALAKLLCIHAGLFAVLELYLKLYRRVAGSGTYLDAFAGEGRISVDGQPRDSSALVAARSTAFKHLFVMEIKPHRNSRLRRHLDNELPARTAQRCTVLPPGDANVQVPELLADGVIDRSRPVFALLDPDSTQLDWATVEASLATRSATTLPTRGPHSFTPWVLDNGDALAVVIPAVVVAVRSCGRHRL
jgi:three-Cys-motif partner protein